MSRSIGGGGTDPLLLVAVLVVGAMLYTRSMRPATAATVPGRTAYVPGSMAGSSGSGAAQVVGGLVGGVMDWFKSGSSWGSGMPDTYNAVNGGLNSFGVTGDIGGSADDPWYG